MAKKDKNAMKFKKGDGAVHYFKLPIAEYTPGGELWFAAKSAVDNDSTDGQAKINKVFTDDDVELTATQAIWTCVFNPGDIVGVSFSSEEDSVDLLGEFQIVPAVGNPKSFPDDNNYIPVIVYADIKRGV